MLFRDDYQFLNILEIFLVISILIVFVIWEYPVFKEKIKFDFHIKIKRPRFPLFYLAFVLLHIYLSTDDNNASDDRTKGFILLFSLFIVLQIGSWIAHYIKKPITIGVIGNDLMVFNRWPAKRNLKNVVDIEYSRLSKDLKITFKKKSSIWIVVSEFDAVDIHRLLDLIWEKSDSQIRIPRNLPKVVLNGVNI